ncbi:hypothetical protein O181_062045 [Austropuccinia psidii MF-1]|uniref:Uncharacterized protein n=1 Tax=Austropuccinia psidii MF-1 TaxID=1389203 RepID=A0A9Q3EGA4_9BASI|nr:hypothetical protein [Austropuccinia psidii MF-1]
MLLLALHPQNMPPMLPSPLLPLPPTHLILSTSYHSYAHIVPSRHGSNVALTPPYAYHPYGHLVPSRHAPNTTITPPYTSSHKPNPIHHLPFLCSGSTLKMKL